MTARLFALPRPRTHWLAVAVAAVLGVMLPRTAAAAQATTATAPGNYAGFDLNDYPGDAALQALRKRFSYVGYWLNTPPGAHSNPWVGKRETIAHAGFGFLVLWNGRLDAEIRRARRSGTTPEALGERDAGAAVAAAGREHFRAGTLLFLDQEEGGRLLPEQAAYLLHWTEAVAQAGYAPGVYASGQPVTDGPGQTITTAEDIAARVRAGHLHPVALWVAQDTCGPAPGCALPPPAAGQSGTPEALVWQYAQSPRRPELTRSCARTYAANGSCVIPELPALALDLNVSSSADPSHGR